MAHLLYHVRQGNDRNEQDVTAQLKAQIRGTLLKLSTVEIKLARIQIVLNFHGQQRVSFSRLT